MDYRPNFTPPPPDPMYNRYSFVHPTGIGADSDGSSEQDLNPRPFYSQDQLNSTLLSPFTTPAQDHQAGIESSVQAAQNLTSWLQQLHLDASAVGQSFLPSQPELPASRNFRQSFVPGNAVVPSSPIYENNGNNTRNLELLNLQLVKRVTEANESIAAKERQISDLKNRLLMREKGQRGQNRFSDHRNSDQFYIERPGDNNSTRRFAIHPHEPAIVIAPPYNGHQRSMTYAPSIPLPKYPPRREDKKQSGKGRHHRTATPEQRQLRALTNGRPVYTLGIDPQTDRGLLCDFFEQIKSWSAAYTVQLGTLAAEKVRELAANAGLVEYLGTPAQFSRLVVEHGMLKSVVSAIVSRYIFAYTIDEHAMFLSRHAEVEICERLAHEWTLLRSNEHEKKLELLALQREIYTKIKNAEDHKEWRTNCAKEFASQLLSKLNGFLTANLPFTVAKDRDHRLQELFVKGYRIGFRLRMDAMWQFQWPVPGDQFQPTLMVNESRMLYGDIMTTMREVMSSANEHYVRFAISPTMVKSELGEGRETKEVVVHSALVHMSRKGWP